MGVFMNLKLVKSREYGMRQDLYDAYIKSRTNCQPKALFRLR
jgi:hypothetical protein